MDFSFNQILLIFLLYVKKLEYSNEAISSFNWKWFYYLQAWFSGSCKGSTSFYTWPFPWKPWLFFSIGLTSLSNLSLFPLSIAIMFFVNSFWCCFVNCTVCLDLFRNIIILLDLLVHHKGWLTYSGGTDRPIKLWHNFHIPIFYISIISRQFL